MSATRRTVLAGAIASATLLRAPFAAAQPAGDSLSDDEILSIAKDAYIYGYSLITTEYTRQKSISVPKAEGMRAPMGQFANALRYPPADYRDVSAPNADTLYSIAWLDLSEPQVFSHPDMGKRFYLFEMVDLWMTDFETPGARTSGGAAASYLITGPGWTGKVPEGMKQIKSASRYICILGRTYANGTEEDYKIVNTLQAQYSIVPLSAYGKPFTFVAPAVDPHPAFNLADKPQDAILGLGAKGYFDLMTTLMAGAAPPAREDAPFLARMAKIGIAPGKPFDPTKFSAAVQTRFNDIPKAALLDIEAHKDMLGEIVNGWVVTKGLWHLRDQLYEKGGRRRLWLAGEPRKRRGLSLHRGRQRGSKALGRQQIHSDLRKGTESARQRLLVDHHV